MSFTDLVEEYTEKDQGLRIIRSQAETELGREMEENEEALLLSRFQPEQLCQHIHKV